MKVLSVHLLKNMKRFSIEKVLKTGSNCGGESRLGTIQFTVPSYDATVNGEKPDSSGNRSCSKEDQGGKNLPVPDVNDAFTEKYKTPMYMIHTQTGTIPHITPEVLKLIYPSSPNPSSVANNQIPPVQISIDSTIRFTESLEKFGKGIGKFVGLPEIPVFVTIHDSLQPLKSNHNDKFGIALWSRHGRTSLTPELFVKALKGFKPSLCQILSDYDVRPETSGTKRLKKSLARAEEYSDFVIKEKSSIKFNQNQKTDLFITIEAAWFEMNEDLARKTVANLLESQHRFEGVVIAGLTDRFEKGSNAPKSNDNKKTGEPCKLDICEELNIDLLEQIVKVLPPTLPKYVPGPFGLPQMVDLLSKGIDILDSSVTTKMADNAEAILLDKVEASIALISASLKSVSNVDNEALPERSAGENSDTNQLSYGGSGVKSAVISLKDKQFFDDFRPLSSYCSCYTCRKHTRSYIHHLYATDELLGPVLIQIHNLTVMDRFFQIIRGILHDSDSPETAQEKFMLVKKLVHKSPCKEEINENCNHGNDLNTKIIEN